MSPEPVSNIVTSLGEDGMVIAGFGLMAMAPVAAFFVFLTVVIIAVWLSRKTIGVIRRGIIAMRERNKV
jgi:hypothetical protein